MKKLHVVRFNSANVFSRLMLDEALFRDPLKRNWIVVEDEHIEQRCQPSVVLGISGRADELVHMEQARQDTIPLMRRFTGGGTVSVDSDAFLTTIVCNANDILPFGSLKPYPREIMTWSDEYVFRPSFVSYARSSDLSFKARESDYVVNDVFKVGGNAQGISGNRFCHHTSFLWKVNPKTMSYLKMPRKKPEYRAERDHHDFLRGLAGLIESRQVFMQEAINHLCMHLGAELVEDTENLIPQYPEPSRNVML